jgi:hypothetical protein
MRTQSVDGTPSNGGQVPDAVKQRRVLNKLVKSFVAYSGVALADIASKPKAARCQRKRRLLYRQPSNLTEADLNALIAEIGFDRLWRALDRCTQPELPMMAAE